LRSHNRTVLLTYLQAIDGARCAVWLEYGQGHLTTSAGENHSARELQGPDVK
jgi:hypothetical protein